MTSPPHLAEESTTSRDPGNQAPPATPICDEPRAPPGPLVLYQPYPVPQDRPVLVDRPVPVPVQVPVDRQVPFPVHIPYQIPPYIPVEVRVPVPVPVPVPVQNLLLGAPEQPPPQHRHEETTLQPGPALALAAPADRLMLPPPPRAPQPRRPPQLRRAPLPEPLRLTWHEEPSSAPATPTSKRTANQALDDSSGGSQDSSPRYRQARKLPKKVDISEWPPAWVEAYNDFQRNPKDDIRRKALFQSWDPALRRQAWYRVHVAIREKCWEAELSNTDPNMVESSPPTPTSQSSPAPSPRSPAHLERNSHNWMEGERIGEAANPRPQDRNRSGNRAPGVSRQHAQVSTARHGVRGAPQPDRNLNDMNNRTIGTLGNDGRSGAEDLRPRWRAGSQPESRQPSRSGSSGVHVDQQRDVRRHVVQPAPQPLRGPAALGQGAVHPALRRSSSAPAPHPPPVRAPPPRRQPMGRGRAQETSSAT